MRARNEKGFTILELMIVVVIIGILIAIAVPSYGAMVGRAKTASCKANQSTLESGAAVYWADTGNYPSAISDIVGYLSITKPVACPSGGTYSISEGEITCSEAGHN